jgi:hypothetical protein
MINNTVSLAQYKLKLHQDKGQNSELSIMEVAKLMDIIYFGPCNIEAKKESIFLQFCYN